MVHQNVVYVTGKSGSIDQAREKLSQFSYYPFEDALRGYAMGGPEQVAKRIAEIAEAGINHFIIWPLGFDYAVLEFIANEIAPRFA